MSNITNICYENIAEFDRDFKKLSKRYQTLSSDFETMKKATIEAYYIHKINNNSIFPIEGLCGDGYTSNKVRKFACRALKGRGANSGIRVIFVFQEDIAKVTFIEIYHKSDKENENKERIKDFIKDNLVIE